MKNFYTKIIFIYFLRISCTVWLFSTIHLLVRLILRSCRELTDEVFKFTLAVLYNCFCMYILFCILSLGSLLLILSYFFILFILLFLFLPFLCRNILHLFIGSLLLNLYYFFIICKKEINSLAVMEQRHSFLVLTKNKFIKPCLFVII